VDRASKHLCGSVNPQAQTRAWLRLGPSGVSALRRVQAALALLAGAMRGSLQASRRVTEGTSAKWREQRRCALRPAILAAARNSVEISSGSVPTQATWNWMNMAALRSKGCHGGRRLQDHGDNPDTLPPLAAEVLLERSFAAGSASSLGSFSHPPSHMTRATLLGQQHWANSTGPTALGQQHWANSTGPTALGTIRIALRPRQRALPAHCLFSGAGCGVPNGGSSA